MVQSLGTRETGSHSYMYIPLDYLPGSQAEEINIKKKKKKKKLSNVNRKMMEFKFQMQHNVVV